MSVPLLLSLGWSLLLLAASLCLAYRPPRGTWWLRYTSVVVVGLVLAVRLLPNALLPMGAVYDIESYSIVGDHVLAGSDVYTSEATLRRHPYLPLQLYWLALARYLATEFGLAFVKVVRLAPILADAGISLALLAWQRRQAVPPEKILQTGLLFAFSPISVFVSAYHGQFDSLPILCMMLALLTGRHTVGAGGWLGLGILFKSWPVLVVPSFLNASASSPRRLRFLVALGAVPLVGVLLYTLLFQSDPTAIASRTFSYNHGFGVWGYTFVVSRAAQLSSVLAPLYIVVVRYGRFLTLAAVGLVWLLRARRESLAAGLLTTLVAFLACTHAFSIQYLSWLLPFALLESDRTWFVRYTLAAFAYMFLTYGTLILEMHITTLLPWPQADQFLIIPASLPAWLVCVGWLRARMRGRG